MRAQYGYTTRDFNIERALPAKSLSVRIRVAGIEDRKVVGYIPSYAIENQYGVPYAYFVPDPSDVDNQFNSAVHRYGRAMPDPNGRKFFEFCKAFIKAKLKPVSFDEILTDEEWLDQTSYSNADKSKIKTAWEGLERIDDKLLEWAGFLKDEGYEKPKNPRSINAPNPALKKIFGPLFKAIDKATYRLKWFVKGINPRDYVDLLEERLGDSAVMGTDFTSFEAHHRGVVSSVVHYWMMHMLRDVCAPTVRKLLTRIMFGVSISRFSKVTTKVDQRLMSGAMWTSSSNGITNLLLNLFLIINSREPGLTVEGMIDRCDGVVGVVEGDDGLFKCSGIDPRLLSSLGLNLKYDYYTDYSSASFCGVVVDRVDRKILADPRKVLSNFFRFPRNTQGSIKKIRALTRAKAMSYLTNYHDTPVLGPLAHRICELTKGVDVRSVTSEMDERTRHFIEICSQEKSYAVAPDVGSNSRMLFAQRYGFSLNEQLLFESDLKRWDLLRPLILPEWFELSQAADKDYRFLTEELIAPLGVRPSQNLVSQVSHLVGTQEKENITVSGSYSFRD